MKGVGEFFFGVLSLVVDVLRTFLLIGVSSGAPKIK